MTNKIFAILYLVGCVVCVAFKLYHESIACAIIANVYVASMKDKN